MSCGCGASFKTPTFNLTVDIYTAPMMWPPFGPLPPPRLTSSCALKNCMCDSLHGTNTGLVNMLAAFLYLPKLTDIRDTMSQGGKDYVEVVPGSGRWYTCECVEDANKGFPNEFRYAVLRKVGGVIMGGGWPNPMP